MMAPSLIGIALFSYGPAIEAVRHSFYNWDGLFTEEFIGLDNFRLLLGNLSIWFTMLGGGLLIFFSTAASHRKTRLLQYSGITLLIIAALLIIKDAAAALSPAATPGSRISPQDLIPLLWFAAAFTAALSTAILSSGHARTTSRALCTIIPITAGIFYLTSIREMGDWLLWKSFRLIFIMIIANLLKMWPAIFAAVCIHRMRSERWKYLYRVLFVIPMIIPQMVGLLIWKFFYDPNIGLLNSFLTATHLDHILIWLDKYVMHLGIFTTPFHPAWLGHPNLIIPALLFWGFPWVGVVGVLIYLSGLQNIGQDVYEAAEIDGIGSWGKFTRIELPLIMTQVRLNLVLMIIGTLQAYGFQLVLLGAEGGPRNKGLTPGLYMFYESFQNNNYGYACAIGLMLFFIIMFLTIINQRYVRVDK